MRIDPNCVACGGSGENTKGNPCIPCEKNGEEVWAEVNVLERYADADVAATLKGYEVLDGPSIRFRDLEVIPPPTTDAQAAGETF